MCAMILGDLGADVIKVERPGMGDEARRHGDEGRTSPYFASLNRNKRSICIDLKTSEGIDLLDTLLARSDVLIENLRPGAMERLGFGDERIRTGYPHLTVCHITGFGRDGPWADAAAYDHIIQGFSGFMSLTGPAGSGGFRAGASIADVTTGTFACNSILAALLAQRADGARGQGRGSIIDISLLGSMLNVLGYQSATYLSTGAAPEPVGNEHPYIAPYGSFATSDNGMVNICVGNDLLFERLCKVVDLPHIARDSRFINNASRVEHREDLNRLLRPACRARGTEELLSELRKAGVPCGPIHSLLDALNHPQTEALGMTFSTRDSRGDLFRLLQLPFTSSTWEATVRRPPPCLGEHEDMIIAELEEDSELER
jgi:crotonobetainyl-CoA:carnitine CoA-transferase CaiB-like acyl-CoA transferase